MARSSEGFILMCGKIRLASDDSRKSGASLKEQITKKRTCCLEWCDEPITQLTGPGKDSLCREHQLYQREYGGLGRLDRPWTFARNWVCDWCGYNPKEDPWFAAQNWEDENHLFSTMRTMLVGDHKIRKTDGGSDDPNNVQTLCQNCNSKKTGLHKDHQRSKIS